MCDCLVRCVFADNMATTALDTQVLVDDRLLNVIQVQVLPICNARHRLADEFAYRLHMEASLGSQHPIWSSRPYKVFRRTPEAVRACVKYVEENPAKEGLAPQCYPFAQAYNNWPYHKPR